MHEMRAEENEIIKMQQTEMKPKHPRTTMEAKFTSLHYISTSITLSSLKMIE